MTGVQVEFPNLGIVIHNLKSGFYIFDFKIAFYGMIIATGMILGYFMAEFQAKRTGQKADLYMDLALIDIPISVICARIYYVVFAWNEYKDNPISVLYIRNGGLAIYGAVIGGVTTAIIFAKLRKVSIGLLLDTAVAGLITGQIIGRWGNFFNCEAFGGYAKNTLLAMKLPWDTAVAHMSANSANELSKYVVDDTILVHPTFLYESLWNIGVLIIILLYTKRKKFDGELLCIYMFGYGLGRMWIENLRTDQLLLWNTNIPVSMCVSGAMMLLAVGIYIYNMTKLKKTKA
ncbi:MAG: prolipoprotein diacylglyceryl transferase [Lachnospiraceae bacterium]|nr:prolipoprotein diacylglyceryl transferase [Lachnospiraceae bacterium]